MQQVKPQERHGPLKGAHTARESYCQQSQQRGQLVQQGHRHPLSGGLAPLLLTQLPAGAPGRTAAEDPGVPATHLGDLEAELWAAGFSLATPADAGLWAADQ